MKKAIRCKCQYCGLNGVLEGWLAKCDHCGHRMTEPTAGPPGGTPPPVDYGVWLTGQLAALGVSRNALARALGHRGASQVSRWCAGLTAPRPKAQRAIERALAALTDPQPGILGPETHEDAPGGTNAAGEVSYPPPVGVERYVVEGG